MPATGCPGSVIHWRAFFGPHLSDSGEFVCQLVRGPSAGLWGLTATWAHIVWRHHERLARRAMALPELHALIGKLQHQRLFATLQFFACSTIVVLPILTPGTNP